MNQENDIIVVKELRHQYRTMNMWLTIYEKLYSRYRMRTRLLELALLICSILLCLTTFVDSRILRFLLITPGKGQMILGFSSLAVLVIALLLWILDWKEKAASFGGAVDTLNKTYTECYQLLKLEAAEIEDLRTKSLIYSAIIHNLPKIAEQDFHKLKAFHKRQMELDKMIELYPGSSVWLLKISTFFQANIHVLLRKPFNNSNDDLNSNQ
jgi:hypothetical protein